jgi:hypothetical protein
VRLRVRYVDGRSKRRPYEEDFGSFIAQRFWGGIYARGIAEGN